LFDGSDADIRRDIPEILKTGLANVRIAGGKALCWLARTVLGRVSGHESFATEGGMLCGEW
jgi:hypothetical protein